MPNLKFVRDCFVFKTFCRKKCVWSLSHGTLRSFHHNHRVLFAPRCWYTGWPFNTCSVFLHIVFKAGWYWVSTTVRTSQPEKDVHKQINLQWTKERRKKRKNEKVWKRKSMEGKGRAWPGRYRSVHLPGDFFSLVLTFFVRT